MDNGKYDFLFGGGYAIKDYYMESANPRQMRGASELLTASAVEVADAVKLVLKHAGLDDAHIIQSGATLSATVPRGEGAGLAANAEAIFRKKCLTASAAFVSVPYIDADTYSANKQRALSAYERRKAEKYIPWEIQDAQGDTADFSPNDRNAPTRCPRCRLRTPKCRIEHISNGEVQYLCKSCAKREMKSSDRKYDLRRECGDQFDYDYEINTTTELADGDGRIALLYADVNNLGGQADKTSFEEDKQFHEAVQKVIENAVHTAIREAMKLDERNRLDQDKYRAQFEIIALGGDDVCLLLPGNVALFTAWKIAEVFDNNDLGLTISVTACVANDTTALTYMEKICQGALEYIHTDGNPIGEKATAKTLAHQTNESTLQLSYLENPSDLFPMKRACAGVFIALLREAAASSMAVTALRTISEARRELIDEEFDLYYAYYKSRQAVEKTVPVLDKIHQEYADKKNPWRDFVTWRGQKLGK